MVWMPSFYVLEGRGRVGSVAIEKWPLIRTRSSVPRHGVSECARVSLTIPSSTTQILSKSIQIVEVIAGSTGSFFINHISRPYD